MLHCSVIASIRLSCCGFVVIILPKHFLQDIICGLFRGQVAQGKREELSLVIPAWELWNFHLVCVWPFCLIHLYMYYKHSYCLLHFQTLINTYCLILCIIRAANMFPDLRMSQNAVHLMKNLSPCSLSCNTWYMPADSVLISS